MRQFPDGVQHPGGRPWLVGERGVKRDMFPPTPALTGGARDIGPLADLMSVQLRRVDVFLIRGFASAAEEMKIRSGMIACLGLIVGNPGISQKEISEQTGRDKSIIVSLVNDLEERGWARRTRSLTDHRRYELLATPEGERQLEQIAGQIREMENALLADITPEELQTVSDLLQRMHNSCVAALREMPE